MDQNDPRTPLRQGERLEEYRIEGVLGCGGFAYTYRAMDTNLDTEVALKEFFPELAYRDSHTSRVRFHSGAVETGYREGLERFIREGKILAGFNHHNIVRIFRALRANDTAYLVMDYERGVTLQDYLDQHRNTLDYEELKAIFVPLLDGLREVHLTPGGIRRVAMDMVNRQHL